MGIIYILWEDHKCLTVHPVKLLARHPLFLPYVKNDETSQATNEKGIRDQVKIFFMMYLAKWNHISPTWISLK